MKRAYFNKEQFNKDQDKMTAYQMQKEDNFNEASHPFHESIYAAGGLLTSVKELENYLLVHMNKGKFNGKKIISEKLLTEIHSEFIERSPSIFGKEHYGYGWAITTDFFGEKMIHHGGSTALSSAYLAILPDKGYGVAIAGNVGNVPGGQISQAIFLALLGKNPINDHPALKFDNKIGVLIGEYETYKGINKITIKKKGPLLYAEIKEENILLPLIPKDNEINNYNFYIPMNGYTIPIDFHVDNEKGSVSFFLERNKFNKK
jgi:CubicO group peptidase (beta-lactamase class C family)